MKIAMILAAGRGERLRPLTDVSPKPLCKINNIPLIDYHLAHLKAAGFERVVINHSYLGGQIREHVGDGKRWDIEICYLPEPPGALETGGAIVNALPLLGKEPFLVVNADVFTDYDFAVSKELHDNLAHLVLVPKSPFFTHGDFGLLPSHHLDNEHRDYIYAGIAFYHPRCFAHHKMGRYSLTPLFRQLANDKKITGEVYTGKWINIDSIERLRIANGNGSR
jgi:MurNAc alpha-1-phosphate uridylyltransferase